MPEATVLLPPLKMHATQPSRSSYVYALCDEIHESAGGWSNVPAPLRCAVEELGYIAAGVACTDRNSALRGLRRVREAQLHG